MTDAPAADWLGSASNTATRGTKVLELLARRSGMTVDQIAVAWLKGATVHSPREPVVTLFDAGTGSELVAMGQRWIDPVPPASTPGWVVDEYVVLDGDVPASPGLDGPDVARRSGFVKITFLVSATAGVVHEDLFRHWRDVHAPRVCELMRDLGGIRYVLNQSRRPASDPYVGVAELYVPDDETYAQLAMRLGEDRSTVYRDGRGTKITMSALRSEHELVGVHGS